jgi:TRAP-type mannitol/chloroaromatic compound transport system permease small subunit
VPLLLRISQAIDGLNLFIGQGLRWLILAAVLISAGNAVMRKAFNIGSNAFLEIQWYLFAAVFMLGAAYALLKNAHVRIDFLSSRLSPKAAAWVDVLGLLLVVLPLCALMGQLAWPLFEQAWRSGEMSQNAGGLVRWPVLLLMPFGFGLLFLQALSELIKRLGFLSGHLDHAITPERREADALLVHERNDLEGRA